MPLTARRPVVALVLTFCTLVTAAVLAAPTGTAAPRPAQDQTTCPNREAPPAPVDTSEQPAPGQKAPTPLPVPDQPIGGGRLGECGLILPPNAPQPPDNISAETWLLADLDSGAVLAANDPHGRQRPASVIKVLLGMLAARDLKPDVVITANQEDANQECTCVGLVPGGQYTVHQLLQALLMSSGNDVPHALARALGGVPNALRKMNALAKELGAQDTFAASTSGLDAPGMSTSAYDVALIFRAALKYPEFAQAIATTRAELPATGGHAAIPLRNDNTLLTTYNGALGGKTGFTDDAQATYVGGAQRDGHRLVAVLLRGTRAPLTMPDQAAKLLDYGFGLVGVGEGNPIGKLVDGAPQPKTDEVKATGQAVADGQPKAAGAAPQNSAMTAAFGNAGGPLTIAAALFLLVAFVMYLKRRRAKLARAARAAAASQMS